LRSTKPTGRLTLQELDCACATTKVLKTREMMKENNGLTLFMDYLSLLLRVEPIAVYS
jgi:hypothetical protein